MQAQEARGRRLAVGADLAGSLGIWTNRAHLNEPRRVEVCRDSQLLVDDSGLGK